MTKQRYLCVLAASLLALGAISAHAAGGGNGGGGNGGGNGAGGHGGAGGLSGSHASHSALSNSNGFMSSDRDRGLARAADRSGTIAARDGVQPGKGHLTGSHSHSHAHAHSHTTHTGLHTKSADPFDAKP